MNFLLRPLAPAPAAGAALLGLLLVVGATGAAQAQIDTEFWRLASAGPEAATDGFEPALGFRGTERVIKGAPFCADAQHENVQWLPDPAGGAPNRIVRRTEWSVCRDGEGRTRQEVQRDGRRVVYLRDPVARENWVLYPERRLARASGTVSIDGVDREALRDFTERMREWARDMADRVRRGVDAATAPTPPQPPVPPAMLAPPAPLSPAAPAPVLIAPGDDAQRRTEVQVIRLPAQGFAAELPPAPVRSFARIAAPRGPGHVSALPARDIEGVRANGERTTWTIEAGQVGNERPIQILRDVWTAPELMLTVLSRDFDPRQGEQIYRLVNLKRGEPDAALMRVPADYTKSPRGERRPTPPAGQGQGTGAAG